MIVDYSTIRPPMAALTALGVTAVGRYIGWDGEPGFQNTRKNITRAEAAQLHAAGIAVFLSFEYAADAAARGAAQGARDAALAARQLAALGAPAGAGLYFALDFDIPDYAPALSDTPANARAKLGPAAHYFDAIHATGPAYQVGAYGGYYAVKRLFDAGLIALGWQTIAWSAGQRDKRAQLYQVGGTTLAGGGDVDVHESAAPDFGQWPRPAAPKPPAPKPPPVTLVEVDVKLAQLQAGSHGQAVQNWQGLLVAHGLGYLIAIPAGGDVMQRAGVDGVFGARTEAATKAFQKGARLPETGVVDAATWQKALG